MQVRFREVRDSFKMSLRGKIMDKEQSQVLIGKSTNQMKKVDLTASAKLSPNFSLPILR